MTITVDTIILLSVIKQWGLYPNTHWTEPFIFQIAYTSFYCLSLCSLCEPEGLRNTTDMHGVKQRNLNGFTGGGAGSSTSQKIMYISAGW